MASPASSSPVVRAVYVPTMLQSSPRKACSGARGKEGTNVNRRNGRRSIEAIRRIMPCRRRSHSTTPHWGTENSGGTPANQGSTRKARELPSKVASCCGRLVAAISGYQGEAMCECPVPEQISKGEIERQLLILDNRVAGKWILAAASPGAAAPSLLLASAVGDRTMLGRTQCGHDGP